ncbi:MAG: PDZ domain-containing protein [Candidatus Saccharicenans sp.]
MDKRKLTQNFPLKGFYKVFIQKAFCRSQFLIKTSILLAVFIFLISTLSQAADLTNNYPAYRSLLGVHFAPASGQKLVIDLVSPNSPATQAGLKPGDVLIAIDGKVVSTPAEASELINFHPPYDKIELTLERQGKRFSQTATLLGRLRLENITPPKIFFIPAVDTPEKFNISSPVESLDAINTLSRVLINPNTGIVEFIGSYDSSYPTGPIPYRQLLQGALASPESTEPSFSLDPDSETVKQMDELFALKEADLTRFFGPGSKPQERAAWFRRWVDLILSHPLLEVDRQIFLERLGRTCGLSKNEVVEILNYVNLGGVSPSVPPDILEIQLCLLKNTGYEQAARAYELLRQGGQAELFQAARLLGRESEAKNILEAPELTSKPEPEKLKLLKAFVVSQIARNTGYLSDQQADMYFSQVKQGKLSLENFDTWLQQRLIPDRDSAGRNLIYEALNGLPLSNELLNLFYGVTIPQIALRFEHVPPESALGQVLYEADYMLKTIDLNQEIFRSIPNHRTLRELELEVRAKSPNLKITTSIRFWLEPQKVELFIGADGKEITFGQARVELKAETQPQIKPANLPAYTPEEIAATQKIADNYAAQINSDYERYAHEFPALHKLTETAKVLALAKWLYQNKLNDRINLTSFSEQKGASEAYWNPPPRVPGLYHIFMKIEPVKTPEGKEAYAIFMPLAVEGGVKFVTKKNWITKGPLPPSYEPATSSLTLSAALAEASVKAADNGQLETARTLAEKSAEAMQGKIKLSELPANLPTPNPKMEIAATPEAVRLLKETNKVIYSITEQAGKGASPSAEEKSFLTKIGQELGKINSGGAVGSDFLKLLQTRQTMPLAGGRKEIPAGTGQLGEKTTPPVAFDCASYIKQFQTPEAGADLEGKRKEFFEAKIAEIQHQLEIICQAAENLSRLNQQNLAELDKWQKEISKAYEEAQDRLMDAVGLLLIDGPLDILQKRRTQMKEAIGNGIFSSILARKAAINPEEAALLDNQVFNYLKLKYRYESIYGQAEQLEKRLSEAKAIYDLDQWANSDKSDYQKIKEGLLQLTEMMLNEPAIGGSLKLGKVTGETLLRWLSLYKAASAASGFFWDILQQKFAWEPVINQLLKSIDQNREALLKLQQKAALLRTQLQCLKNQ